MCGHINGEFVKYFRNSVLYITHQLLFGLPCSDHHNQETFHTRKMAANDFQMSGNACYARPKALKSETDTEEVALNTTTVKQKDSFPRKMILLALAVNFAVIIAIISVTIAITLKIQGITTAAMLERNSCTCNISEKNDSVARPVSSCSMLPKSSPSGYYEIISSNGSTLRVYCDMKKMCGTITGGWMRVVSLDMRQASSKCPSSLCVVQSSSDFRTCRRCYSSKTNSVPSELYHVGISYTHVCGRIKAYQRGTTDGYHYSSTNYFDGISLTYGYPEIYIWAFIASLESNYRHSLYACPCMNSSDNIASPPDFIGNNYFCDTGAVNAYFGKFFRDNPLWDGSGCKGDNECCSFNSPPWFYKKLLAPTEEPIVMKVRLNEEPANEDLAIELIDIYVQ